MCSVTLSPKCTTSQIASERAIFIRFTVALTLLKVMYHAVFKLIAILTALFYGLVFVIKYSWIFLHTEMKYTTIIKKFSAFPTTFVP